MEFDALSVFRMYDVNGDGYLRGEDLAAFADKLCHDLLPPGDTERRQALQDAYRELWTQLSAVADVDRSGHIGEQEYLAAMGRGAGYGGDHFRAATLHAIDALADALDADGDGTLTAAECARVLQSGMDIGTTEDLSREQFRTVALHLFPLADTRWLSKADSDPGCRGIALVAHDTRKADLLAWARDHQQALAAHNLFGTGTTGTLLKDQLGLPVTALRSGPLGGDQQIGAHIAEGEIDLLVFFWDPLGAHPHGDDVRALIRLATLANVAIACNKATADLIMSAPQFAPA